MNKKYTISIGTDIMQSVNKNTFNETMNPIKTFSFTPRKSGHVTSTDSDYISLERRRKYQYYEKK